MPESAKIFTNINGVGSDNGFHANKLHFLDQFIKDLSKIDIISKSKLFRKFIDFDQNIEDNAYLVEPKVNENLRYDISSDNIDSDDNQ